MPEETPFKMTTFKLWMVIILGTCINTEASDFSVEVYDGTEAETGMFPSIGYVYLEDYEGNITSCGATLIDSEYAVSAAHCFCKDNTSEQKNFLHKRIIVGDVDYTIQSKFHQQSSFDYFIHENYDHENTENDIALLHLAKTLETTESVKPEKLSNSSNETETYDYCQVAGWGLKDETTETTKLLYANLSFAEPSECRELGFFNESTMLCARSDTSDACVGDSGGPLYCYRSKENTRELVGIVSFGVNICSPSHAGVYTRVSAYQKWIEANTASKKENLYPLWITLISCLALWLY